MLKSISFSSYKRFKDENKLQIKPVTILVGKNSSGKSSVCKLIPTLVRSITPWNKSLTPILFNTDGISLGTSFSDISHNGDSVGLTFCMEFSEGFDIKVDLISEDLDQSMMIGKYTLTINNEKYILSYDRNKEGYNNNFDKDAQEKFISLGLYNEELFKRVGVDDKAFWQEVDYVGPFRVIPQRTYYSKGFEIEDHVGIMGEKAYDVLYSDTDVTKKVSQWYNDNFGSILSVDGLDSEMGAYHINLTNPLSQKVVNIVDEGQGMSQVLPIVTRCFMKEKDSIVVMEQPELHLHPKAHAALGELFAKTSKENSQYYVIETHSENLLLGLRNAVVDESIDFNPDDIIIYFVDEDEDDGSAYLREITINDEGMLSYWPTGVFNESYDLLSEIRNKVLSRKAK